MKFEEWLKTKEQEDIFFLAPDIFITWHTTVFYPGDPESWEREEFFLWIQGKRYHLQEDTGYGYHNRPSLEEEITEIVYLDGSHWDGVIAGLKRKIKMSKYPNMITMLKEAFQKENAEYIEEIMLYLIDSIVAQCTEDERYYYDHLDIEDIPLPRKYTDGDHPKDLSQAYDMLVYGDLVLPGQWRIHRTNSNGYLLFQSLVPTSSVAMQTLDDLITVEHLDSQLRGWTFKHF